MKFSWYRYNPAGPLALELSVMVWVVFFLITVPALGQNSGSVPEPDDIHLARYLSDTSYQRITDDIEAWLYRIQDKSGNSRSLLTLPVVVHVMHLPQDSVPDNTTSNLSDDQIHGAIDMLNKAFRNTGPFAGDPSHSNSGITSADLEIEFCLAKNDPNGNPTNGIIRVPTALSDLKRDDLCPGSMSTQDECLKALSYWNSSDYINIWLVNSICTDSSNTECGIPGYSYLAAAHGQPFDGPVIDAEFFSPDPAKITHMVHNMGHYLNLFDTYFDPPGNQTACENGNCLLDGDRVCDTPPDGGTDIVNCGTGETINTCSTDADDTTPNNPFISDVEDLYENFMDQGNPSCQMMFTPGQKIRIRNTLLGIRTSLLTSNGCYIPFRNVAIKELINPTPIACGPPMNPKVRIVNQGNIEITSMQIRQTVNLQSPKVFYWTGKLVPGDSVDIRLHPENLQPGTHHIRVRITDVNGQGNDENELDDLVERIFAYVANDKIITEFPYCRDFEDKNMPSDWTAGDYDQEITFDIHSISNCNENGNYMLRYNTNGMWHLGGGVSAGPGGTVDAMVSPLIDLSGKASATLTFDVAYKAMNPENDLTLSVSVSDDCGETFIPVFSKNHTTLQTATSPYNPNAVAWEPGGCNEWRTETISLDAWAGKQVYLSIEAILESFYSQNLYIDNICIDATEGCIAPVHIPETAGIYFADQSCTDAEGWTHFYKTAGATPVTSQSLLLLSLKYHDSTLMDIAPEKVSVTVTESFSTIAHDLSDAPYVNNPEGWFVAGRYYSVDVSGVDSVWTRFYYTDRDVKDINQALAPRSVSSHEELIFYSFGSDLDPALENGHTGVSPDRYDEYLNLGKRGLQYWKEAGFGQYFSATILLDSLGSGGIGSGGDALGSGATYPRVLELKGNQNLTEIFLNWSTVVEINTDRYELYRGEDLKNFTKIGEVPAQGTSTSPTDYEVIDSDPIKGTNYYYAIQYHTNGLAAYTDTIRVDFDESRLVKVYPNPFQDILRIKMATTSEAPVRLGIYNGGWQELASFTWLQQDLFAHEVEISRLPPGIYFYVVFFKGKTYRGKIVRTP